ncbi:MAG: type VI secretion system baseplate subunit TssK [Thermoanaerobaculaceae bacterium]|nr:type VI secretion system baseplate subunit TssK [Thermoanaerobaculaceae bacterium]
MRVHPDIHWSEGMLLRPQHLQVAARNLGGKAIDSARLANPFLWGFEELEIADDLLEGFTFGLRRATAVLKDGTFLQLASNLRLAPRDVKDALAMSDGRLPVWLGLPQRRDGEPNAVDPALGLAGQDRRWVVETQEVPDENSGIPGQPVALRKLAGRFFLGNESREGYECLPVAVIQRGGAGSNKPTLVREFVPPVTGLAAWPPLAELVESVLHRAEAKLRFLRAEVTEGRLVLDATNPTGWQGVLKLQILGGFLPVARQLVAAPRLHPWAAYLELARLAGQLAIFEEGGVESVAIPAYDHDRLGECFHQLVYTLEKLLEKMLSGRFIRLELEPRGELLLGTFREEWLAADNEIYLCIESDLDDRALMSRIETAKIGATGDIPLLVQRRLFGLDIELLRRTPGGLPAREDFHYFSISREGPYWAAVEKTRELAVAGGLDARLRFVVYIVTRQQGGPGRE